jgi:hypothetical protein
MSKYKKHLGSCRYSTLIKSLPNTDIKTIKLINDFMILCFKCKGQPVHKALEYYCGLIDEYSNPQALNDVTKYMCICSMNIKDIISYDNIKNILSMYLMYCHHIDPDIVYQLIDIIIY